MSWNIYMKYKLTAAVPNDDMLEAIDAIVHELKDFGAACTADNNKFSIALTTTRPTCLNALSSAKCAIDAVVSVSPLANKTHLKSVKMKEL